MLVAALLLAILGFTALIIALLVGSVTWSWICVVVALAGVVLFAIDMIRHRRRKTGRREVS